MITVEARKDRWDKGIILLESEKKNTGRGGCSTVLLEKMEDGRTGAGTRGDAQDGGWRWSQRVMKTKRIGYG